MTTSCPQPLNSLYVTKSASTGPGTTIATVRIAPNCMCVVCKRPDHQAKTDPNTNATSHLAVSIHPLSPADYLRCPPFHQSFSPRTSHLPSILPASHPAFLNPSLYHSRLTLSALPSSSILVSTIPLMPTPSLFAFPCLRFQFEHSRVAQHLMSYHDRHLCDFLEFSWPISLTKSSPPQSQQKNHGSALARPGIIYAFLEKECSLGATRGPFSANPLVPPLIRSPLQITNSRSSKLLVVLNHSYPHGSLVNIGILKDAHLNKPFSRHQRFTSHHSCQRPRLSPF